MNIVFFMQDTGAVFGAERATLDLARGLRSAGCSPSFFLMVEERMGGAASGLQAAIKNAGFSIKTFSVSGRISLAVAKSVKKTFQSVNGDILHVIGYKANLHAMLSGVKPVVATVHGWLFRTDLKERLYDMIDRWCLRRCSGVICLSTYYRDLLIKCGVEKERLFLVPSGLDEVPDDARIAESFVKDRTPVFGMMGRFSEEKNHELFLTAAADVHQTHENVRFRIAGQGPLEKKLKSRCYELGISDVVDFCGYSEVADFMQSISVYVICSKIENLPYSILEAMAWSRPVIGTKVGGIPDLIEDKGNGYLVASGDRKALADAMFHYIEQPEQMTEMGRVGRTKILESFTLEKSTALHQDAYRLISGQSVPS